MKFVFIDPDGPWGGYNSGIAYLTSTLMANGIDVNVVDLNNLRDNMELRVVSAIKGADYVGLSVKTGTANRAAELARLVKSHNPKCKRIYARQFSI